MSEDDSVIAAAIAALAADREHGATDLAREALNILGSAAARFPEEGLGAYLDSVGARITRSRPTMASVKNAMARALADGPFRQPNQARLAVGEARAWLDHAAKATTEETAAMIPDNATILTCSYSGTVLEALFSASSAGKHPRVIALMSKTGDIAYGERLAASLVTRGMDVHVCPDTVSAAHLRQVTMALIGADRIRPDGSLVNGRPSLRLAEHVRDTAPLYVAAETFKLDDAEHIEKGFEIVPADLITAYITDRGVVQPAQVWGLRSMHATATTAPVHDTTTDS